MAMTKKEARQFVNNPENWSILRDDEYIKISLLSFAGKYWIKYQSPHRNVMDEWMMAENPRTDWHAMNVFHYDMKDKVCEDHISIPQLAEVIWSLDRS